MFPVAQRYSVVFYRFAYSYIIEVFFLLVFRKDIYALACILGGVVFYFCTILNLPREATQVLAALSVIGMRLIAVKYHLQIPALKND